MLLEMAKEETRYLLIEKLKNMIHSFPDYTTSLNVESVTNARWWLYGTVECEVLVLKIYLLQRKSLEAVILR